MTAFTALLSAHIFERNTDDKEKRARSSDRNARHRSGCCTHPASVG